MKKQASHTLETEQTVRSGEGLLPTLPLDSLSTVLALIERVALNPRADVEKLEGIMAMYERLKAKRSRARIQCSEEPDPEKTRPHQDRQE